MSQNVLNKANGHERGHSSIKNVENLRLLQRNLVWRAVQPRVSYIEVCKGHVETQTEQPNDPTLSDCAFFFC